MSTRPKHESNTASPDTRRAFICQLAGLATTGAVAMAIIPPPSRPGPRELELDEADLHQPHTLAG